jgi:hypothetical protein
MYASAIAYMGSQRVWWPHCVVLWGCWHITCSDQRPVLLFLTKQPSSEVSYGRFRLKIVSSTAGRLRPVHCCQHCNGAQGSKMPLGRHWLCSAATKKGLESELTGCEPLCSGAAGYEDLKIFQVCGSIITKRMEAWMLPSEHCVLWQMIITVGM